MLQKAELIKYRYCGTASVIIYTFLNHLNFFFKLQEKCHLKTNASTGTTTSVPYIR